MFSNINNKMIFDNKELHLVIPVVIALILNYVIFIKKWDDNKKNSLLPSAPYIGIIWLCILVSLGQAHYLLFKKNNVTFASLYLIGVIIYCISYPIVTQLDKKKGAMMNVIALIITAILMLVVYEESTEAFLYVIPLFAWISFVNYSDAIVCSGYYEKDKPKSNKPKSKPKSKKNDISSRFIVL